jgi:hypothetical protein
MPSNTSSIRIPTASISRTVTASISCRTWRAFTSPKRWRVWDTPISRANSGWLGWGTACDRGRRPRLRSKGEPPIEYLGAVVGPFGLLPMTLDEARVAAAAMPAELASQIRFVGMEIDAIRILRDQSILKPRPVRGMADGTSVGPDGLVFAPIGRARPLQIDI